MGGVAIDVEHALALEFEVALAAQTALPVAAGAVAQSVLGVFLHREIDALAVLNVDGGAGGIGERKAVELERSLQRAIHVELAVGAGAREGVGDFTGQVVGLHNADVGARDRDGEILRHVACHNDAGRRATVADADSVVDHVVVGEADLADGVGSRSVAHLIGFAFDGERSALCEGHVARVGGPMDIGDRPNFHVEHLRLGSHDCEADDYE